MPLCSSFPRVTNQNFYSSVLMSAFFSVVIINWLRTTKAGVSNLIVDCPFLHQILSYSFGPTGGKRYIVTLRSCIVRVPGNIYLQCRM